MAGEGRMKKPLLCRLGLHVLRYALVNHRGERVRAGYIPAPAIKAAAKAADAQPTIKGIMNYLKAAAIGVEGTSRLWRLKRGKG